MDRLIAAEVFVRIAERGSMTGAADTLDMSRAMVTRYLAQMEAWAGARLLHRTTRRLSLTQAGEETLARCRSMLDVAGEMGAPSTAAPDEPRGLLRLACSQSLAERVLSSAVVAFLRRHPMTAIELNIGAHAVNLVEERIDLAIRITNELEPTQIVRPLGRCPSVVCASPAYLAGRGTPQRAQDLAHHNCLTYSHHGRHLWDFDHAGERLAVPVAGNLSANETQVLLMAAIDGAGIVMQPFYAVADAIAKGQLMALLPDFVPQSMGVYGIYSSRRQMPAVLRAMLDFLAARFADPAHWPLEVPRARRLRSAVPSST